MLAEAGLRAHRRLGPCFLIDRNLLGKLLAYVIMPEHVHLVIARHRFSVEQSAALLKGAATKQLRRDGLDPMPRQARPRSPWARRQWSVFLDSEDAVENAIRYVEENPIKEGKSRQHWSLVTPFPGLELGGVVGYD